MANCCSRIGGPLRVPTTPIRSGGGRRTNHRRTFDAAGGAVAGVGISSAGPIHLTDGTISPVNIPAWRGIFPVHDRVAAAVLGSARATGWRRLCMALGEHWRGAGRGAPFMLGMVVSTGIGGGLVLDGMPYDGRTGNAGHVGHMIVDVDGPPCGCGARGCVESIASGPHMAAWACEHGWSGRRRQSPRRLRCRRRPHSRRGLPPRYPSDRGDDRLGRRGLRPRPRRRRRGVANAARSFDRNCARLRRLRRPRLHQGPASQNLRSSAGTPAFIGAAALLR